MGQNRWPVGFNPLTPIETIGVPIEGTFGEPPPHKQPGFDWNEFLQGLGQNAGRFVQNLTQLSLDRIGAKPLAAKPLVGVGGVAPSADGLATAKKIAIYGLGALAVAAAIGLGIRLARRA